MMATFRFRLLRFLLGHTRLWAGLVCGVISVILMRTATIPDQLTRVLIGWNAGVVLYLLLTFRMMAQRDCGLREGRVIVHDEGRVFVLVLSVVAVIASLFAAVAELVLGRDAAGGIRNLHLGCAAVTLGSSWIFIHVVFAVHYAREYELDRSRGGGGGLVFPGDALPGHFDFLYFAMVIGTSGQTADVNIASKVMRRWSLVHCVLAFFYNTTVVALTVNIGAGLF